MKRSTVFTKIIFPTINIFHTEFMLFATSRDWQAISEIAPMNHAEVASLFIFTLHIFKAWIIFMLNSVTVKKMDELAQNSVEWLNLYTFHIFHNCEFEIEFDAIF
ncbi:hypothetical protein T08_10413 [Trichinella sp. T8]|nr:hypothetical protein T08_10413 [Trichinella sp. T8]